MTEYLNGVENMREDLPELDELAEWHFIDLFRVIRAAGRCDRDKARAAAAYLSVAIREGRIESPRPVTDEAWLEAVSRLICSTPHNDFCRDVGGDLGCKCGRGSAPSIEGCVADRAQLKLSGIWDLAERIAALSVLSSSTDIGGVIQDQGVAASPPGHSDEPASGLTAIAGSVPNAWHTAPAIGLEAAIAEFKAALPGWWFSVCECQVSCDATCAPTKESPHAAWASEDSRFDHGFDADLDQPSTLADALRDVMGQALAAIAARGE